MPGKLHGRRSLVGYSPWGCKESDMTEQLSLSLCSEVPEEAALWHVPPQGQPAFLGTEIKILAHQSAPSAL